MTRLTDWENAVLQMLENLRLRYERIEIDPEYADTNAFCNQYKYPLDRAANTILVATKRGERRYAAFVCVLGRSKGGHWDGARRCDASVPPGRSLTIR